MDRPQIIDFISGFVYYSKMIGSSLIFFVTGVLTALIPGPDLTFITKSTLSGGFRRGAAACVGILSGILVYLSVSASGLSFIGENFHFRVFTGVFGVVYLSWIAFGLWFDNPDSVRCVQGSYHSVFRVFVSAFLVHLSNPKAILFFGVLLTPFLKDDYVLLHCMSLYSGFILSFFSYAFLISRVGSKFKPGTLFFINRSIAFFFIFFSFKLLFSTLNILF